MSDKPLFEFGENWESYSKELDESRLQAAQQSLEDLLGAGALQNRSFLDIGCGSGLFSVSAVRLGAGPVVGLDVDPVSVKVSRQNAQRWLGDDHPITVHELSVLDAAQLDTLGLFDIVYAWGSLHHTGNMARAIQLASQRVKPGGTFVVAIYNRHFTSPIWVPIKRFYNALGPSGQRLLIWVFTPLIFFAKWLVTFRNPLKMGRGMEFMHNIIDWLGGYPYEYASIPEMQTQLQALGLTVERALPAAVPTGCNEFVCSAS
ncbi:MAG: 50S ribosomal protein L11 methyltransferase [Anaerolineae bacterium]|nr:50S ribosomal protein L11 methyltransferase [Anaerolineae bacterium]